MSGQKDDQEKPKSKRSWGIFGSNRPEQDEINEFIIGDLDSIDNVVIGPKGAVAGNLSAPSINIKGTIFGSVTAPEIFIDKTGQVWGDVFASTLMITVNAKVHGWISTFDIGTLELIQSGALSASDVMSLHLSAQSEELAKLRQSADKEDEIRNLGNQPELHRKFQVEGGSAIIARLELEKSYKLGYSDRESEELKSNDIDDLDSTDMTEESVSREVSSAEIQNELSRTLQNLNDANAEIVSLSAELQISAIEFEQLKSDRDLFKKRFQKLAQWVYQNQGADRK